MLCFIYFSYILLFTIFTTLNYNDHIQSVQSLSHVWLFATPWTADARLPCPPPFLEFTQTHVHWVGDAIQPSHPLLSPSPPVLNLSQHQGLFQWVSSSHQVAKLLELQLQHQFFQWIFRTDFLQDGLVGSLKSSWDLRSPPGDSQVFSTATVQKHQLFGIQFSLESNCQTIHDHWRNHGLCWQSNVSAF